jgi:hypothetical protein
MKCVGNRATYGEVERCIQGLVGKPEGRDHLGDLGMDWRIILKCNYKNFSATS